MASGRVAAIVTSPLERARRTAEAVADQTGLPVEIDERWIELDYGSLDGTPLADLAPEAWQQWRSDPGFQPGGGESLITVAQRVVPACEELLATAGGDDRDVVVVTHVSPLKVALCWALGVEPGVGWRTFVAPGSVTRVRSGPFGPVLTSFNEQPLPPPE
jgi:broad specificity phosphatase PhoE